MCSKAATAQLKKHGKCPVQISNGKFRGTESEREHKKTSQMYWYLSFKAREVNQVKTGLRKYSRQMEWQTHKLRDGTIKAVPLGNGDSSVWQEHRLGRRNDEN